MDIKVFLKSANDPRFAKMLEKFAKGANASISNSTHYEDCDVAVIFGSWKDRPDPHHVVKNDIVKKAKNYIVVETPVIGRGPVTNVMQDDWYRVGLNGFLADDGQFNNKNKDDSRWKEIKDKLNLTVEPYHTGDYIVVTLQVPGDASLRGIIIEQWALNTVRLIRQLTKKQIYVRFPQVPKQWRNDLLQKIQSIKDVYFQTGTKENLDPTLLLAHCTVCYSSTMSVDSLIKGCPTIAVSPANFAYDIAGHDVSEIVDPLRPPREQWLNNLAYTTWHVDEIEKGLPWNHLKELL